MVNPSAGVEPVASDDGAIAVIGMAGRFPGAARLDQFWQNLRAGVESVVELDREELLAQGLDAALLDNERFVPRAVPLDGIEDFDAAFFGYNPRDAAVLDPQHRLFLESAWHALEDAGCIPESFDGSIGVYAGTSLSGYLVTNLLGSRTLDTSPGGFSLLIGNDKDYLPSRVSYTLNLDGPAVAVQTTCSSSLTAVHLAAQALLSYECDVALAGGATVRIPHRIGYLYQEGSILSADGHCRPFDARANGTTIGSGVGVVVLKRLADALADRDRIDAVLLGSAINNDGASKVGYTAPSVHGQSKVIAAALAAADVAPDSITAIEAHGTGTPLGDPIEIAALARVFGDGSDRSTPCLVSSVKSNIGHLDSAAGVASFIKAVLQLRHGELVPSVNFDEPNPEIDFERTPFRVATTATAWKANGSPRRIGVSSFGFGGTNVHAVLEEAPPRPSPGPARPVHVIALSARSQEALDEQTDALAAALDGSQGAGEVVDLADVARTLQTGRRAFRHRRIVTLPDATGANGAAEALAGRDPQRVLTRRAAADPAVCWLFPGQGSQYPGMGAELYRTEPVYRAVVDECAERLEPELGLDLRTLLCEPDGGEAAEQLRQTRLAQPALFTVQVALATLLGEWGVRRDAMLGHSIGELTAAHLAGVFDLPTALRVVALRGRLMDEQPGGLMASVALAEDELRRQLPAGLSVAAVNAPELCVVSGPADAMEPFLAELADREIGTRRLHTSHAFHSAMMQPVVEPFAQALSGVPLRPPTDRFASNRTGTWITAEQATDPRYWAAQLGDPVRFADGIGTLTALDGDGKGGQVVLLEVGPGHTLASLAKVNPQARRATTITTLRAAGEESDDAAAGDAMTLATAVGRLWLTGVDVDWAAVDGGATRRRVELPGYAFQRRRYWVSGGPLSGGGQQDAVLDVPDEPVEEQDSGQHDLAGADPRPELDTPFVEPSTELQRRIAAIWTQLLGIHPIGVHDSFLELGGHSLLALKVVQQVREQLGVEIPLRRLVRAGTVAQLAELATELGVTVDTEDDKQAEKQAQEPDEAAAVPQAVPRPDELHEPFPLTEIQQAQWIGRRGNFRLGNVAAHIYWEVDAEELDIDRLQHAWHAVEARHPMLHAIITPDGQQRILPDVGPYRFPTVDLRDADQNTIDAKLAELRERLSDEMRPSETWPLFEIVPALLPGGRARIFLSFDLLIADIGSIRTFIRDWANVYADPQRKLPPVGLSYRDYVLAARQIRDTPLYQRSMDYWRQRIAELPPAPQLPLATNPAALSQPKFVSRNRLLPKETWRQLVARGAKFGITPSGILLAAYGVVLGNWCRSGELTMNITMINRLPVHPDVEELVGEFASFDLLPIDLRTGAGVADLAMNLQEQGWDDIEHRYVNGVEVLRELARARGGTAGAVMPVVFTSTLVQAAEEGHESLLGWLGEIVHEAVQTPQVWLDAAALEVPGGLYINWPAVDALFPDGLIDDLLDAYLQLLTELAASDEPWQQAPRSLMPAEQRELVARSNDTEGPVPAGLLHDRVLAQAAASPDSTALIAPDATLTYGELVGHAAALGRRLRSLGAGPGQLVGVALPKGAAQVVAALGVLLAGGAYLPIDTELPQARQDDLLTKGACRLVVCPPGGPRTDWPDGVRPVDLDLAGDPGEAAAPEAITRPTDLAYVIFTSGSTGQPKGVAVSHRAALNTCVDINERFEVGQGDAVLGLSSLSFDLSVWDVFGVLGAGGTLVLPEPAARRDPARWLELVRQHEVTVWNSVPALAQMFADYVAGLPDEPSLPIRLALLSGDWIPLELPDRLHSVAPGSRVISLGGATEAAIWSISYEVTDVDPSWESIPYGRPLRNQRFHVLNDRWQECPVHVAGELYIAGVGLAEGYFGDPDRTAAQFVTHPDTGERLYRTGDLGRWRPDGTIEFLGREDFQVKVGGYRIELGEIEAAAQSHPRVRGAVVAALGDRHHRRLVGYLQPADGSADGTEAGDLDEAALLSSVEEHLRERLPSYMIPTSFVVVDGFPLTANGKVDRSALPDPAAGTAAGAPAEGTADDSDGLAAQLTAIVTEVIGVGGIDPTRSFFEFGGDSVSGVQIVSRANQEGIDLTLQDLFELQTIEQIAVALRARGSGRAAQLATEPAPLTGHQRRLLDRLHVGSAPTAHLVQLPVESTVDAELAGRVAAMLSERHPALRLRMVRDGDGTWTQVVPEPDQGSAYVPLIDLTTLPPDRRDRAAESMLAEMAAELDPTEGRVASAALFDLGPAGRRLVWLAHQLAVDDASWAILVEEIRGALSAMQDGGLDGGRVEPHRSTPFPTWARAVAEQVEPERAATPDGAAVDPVELARPAERIAHAVVELAAGDTAELTDAASGYRMLTEEIAFAAVARALASTVDAGRVRFDIERDGRRVLPHLDTARSVGCFVLSSTTVLDLATAGSDPGQLLVAAKESYRAAAPAGGNDTGGGSGSGTVLVRWLGELPELPGPGHDPDPPETASIVVTAALVQGALAVRWSAAADQAELDGLAQATAEALRQLGQHCRASDTYQVSRSDFPLAGLDDSELAIVFGDSGGDV